MKPPSFQEHLLPATEDLSMVSVETVTERFGGAVIASKIRPATPKDVARARRLHAQGRCPHNVVRDTPGWLYDSRDCYVCGKGLGLV